ncbi:hypothetical protein Pyn_32155 [Prunus yedoensis var. nudiflora]|uniref:Uncharacterized protein n=1 Tax=Prunus yedoensis var. nudiflora TaxID=2094558 RepID=A0A314YLV3_PRUYE|nr:hypothetical protein Pyn_32155 [Prunus yedoensis var. nudiflora]
MQSVRIRPFKPPKVLCPKNKKKKNLSIAGVEKNLPTLSSSLAPTPTDSEEEGVFSYKVPSLYRIVHCSFLGSD